MKELRSDGISNMDAANAFLSSFTPATTCAPPRRCADALHRPPNLGPDPLRTSLSRREEPDMDRNLTLRHERRRTSSQHSPKIEGLADRYVDVHQRADGTLKVRHHGTAPPFSVFDPDQQRVT